MFYDQMPDIDCSSPCKGDITQKCGGNKRTSIYYVEGTNTPLPPRPFRSLGCHGRTPTGQRLFTYGTVADNAMTVAKCAEICDGTDRFGLEYGRECWCGNPYFLPVEDLKSAKVPEIECLMLCAGNATETCGGRARLNAYEYGNRWGGW